MTFIEHTNITIPHAEQCKMKPSITGTPRLYIPGTRVGRNNFIFSFLTRVNQPLLCGVRGAVVR